MDFLQGLDAKYQASYLIKCIRLNQIFATHTKKELETIERTMDRDYFMDPVTAKDFGVIDTVIEKRDPSSLNRSNAH